MIVPFEPTAHAVIPSVAVTSNSEVGSAHGPGAAAVVRSKIVPLVPTTHLINKVRTIEGVALGRGFTGPSRATADAIAIGAFASFDIRVRLSLLQPRLLVQDSAPGLLGLPQSGQTKSSLFWPS